ncbi:MAG: hypothetical protein DSY59_02755 [Persephonella sp.]|nr:MAG: hypothetical protein DSY59_02755 [Persephonella sp.]
MFILKHFKNFKIYKSLLILIFSISTFGNAFALCYIYDYGNRITVKKCPKNINKENLKNSFVISTKRIYGLPDDFSVSRICNYYIFYKKQKEKIRSIEKCNKNFYVKFYKNGEKFLCDIYRKNIRKTSCKVLQNNTLNYGDILITTMRFNFSQCINNCEVNVVSIGDLRIYYLKKIGRLKKFSDIFKSIWRKFFGNDTDIVIVASRGFEKDFTPDNSFVFRNDIIMLYVLSEDKKVLIKDTENDTVIYEYNISKDRLKDDRLEINLSEIELKKGHRYEISILNSKNKVSKTLYIVYPEEADEFYNYIKAKVKEGNITNEELANLLCCKSNFYWRCKEFLENTDIKGFECKTNKNGGF